MSKLSVHETEQENENAGSPTLQQVGGSGVIEKTPCYNIKRLVFMYSETEKRMHLKNETNTRPEKDK
jgi:hypothetical protein